MNGWADGWTGEMTGCVFGHPDPYFQSLRLRARYTPDYVYVLGLRQK